MRARASSGTWRDMPCFYWPRCGMATTKSRASCALVDQSRRPSYPQRMSMPPVLTETARPSRRRTAERKSKTANQEKAVASHALEILEQYVLLDGFRIVLDHERSRGSYLFNAASNSRLIDLYGFFGSMPVGYNHPHFDDPAVQKELARAATIKVANSDIYSPGYAEFVETFSRIAGLPPLNRYLFIEGGALANEHDLKA